MSLIALAVVLCAICAVCFVWGYSIGHRGAAEPQEQQATVSTSASAPMVSAPKPNASQNIQEPPADAQPATPEQPVSVSEDSGSAASPASAGSAATAKLPGASSSGPAVVQAALPGQEAAMKFATTGGQVQPAFTQTGQWMVQIAAVNHEEDADVLVGALRKRGYAVSARRDPGDNLIHVQVGPFATHPDAASMRERLLSDGYNALIEP